ncbi:MAG: class I SAM-dependent RNA methyltransferase [bacterium]|nr:class I SAM-dependent RNA methyltransferase [bacterium]
MSTRDDCPHRPPCPGCPRFGESDLPVEAQRSLDTLAENAGLPRPPIHRAPGLAHRHRARLAIRGRARSPKIGLFQSGSHRIVDTPSCAVHHPLINEGVRELKQAIRETGVAPYADRPHRGALRYVQLVVERSSERIQVVLVGNGTEPEILGMLPKVLDRRLGGRLQGLFFNAQPERSNTILGPTTIALTGEPSTRESIAGVDIFFPPAAFGQNHLPLFEHAVDRIGSLIPDRSRITEYYCGVGAIGLGLLARSSEIRFNERSPQGLEGLERGLAERPAAERNRARILRGDAGDRLEGLADADLVIVDPPRKGLDAPLLDALVAAPPRRLIYLACGLPALCKELEVLQHRGGLRLSGIEAFDFFPFTQHVETLAWMDRDGEHFAAAPRTESESPHNDRSS